MLREAILNSAFFGAFLCLLGLQIGLFVKKRFNYAIFNPLLLADLFVIAILYFLDVPFEKFDASARHISFLLTPITVCLAIPLYEQLNLLKSNFLAIISGILGGVIAGLGSIYAMSLAFGLNHEFYVTLLPKSVTAPIGMGISAQHGGIVALTVASIIITGIFSSIFADIFLKIFSIKKSIAKGVALGTSGHAMGTAKAIELGDVEGAMSSLSLAVTGLMTVIGASIFAMFI